MNDKYQIWVYPKQWPGDVEPHWVLYGSCMSAENALAMKHDAERENYEGTEVVITQRVEAKVVLS